MLKLQHLNSLNRWSVQDIPNSCIQGSKVNYLKLALFMTVKLWFNYQGIFGKSRDHCSTVLDSFEKK